jgi:hypothetical protein
LIYGFNFLRGGRKTMGMKIGDMAFLIGIIIALIAGIAAVGIGLGNEAVGIIGIVLVVLGLIVGFLNVKEKETVPFLVAAIALMVTSAVGWSFLNPLLSIGNYIQAILSFIGVFVAPAAVIVALKAVFALAKN